MNLSGRRKSISFLTFMSVNRCWCKKGSRKNIKSTEDLCGLAVGVQNGTIEQGVLRSSSGSCAKQDNEMASIFI